MKTMQPPARSPRDKVLSILRGKVDGETLAIVTSALDDSDRMKVIRDAFLEGRDHEAVALLRELDQNQIWTVLPICSGMQILPFQVAQITARPQLPFRGKRVVIARRSRDFIVNDIRCGRNSMTVQSGDLAGDMFEADVPEGLTMNPIDREEAGDWDGPAFEVKINGKLVDRLGMPLDLPLCMPGNDITLTVTYDGLLESGERFFGCILGYKEHH
jgi:hypothetical protein